MCPRRTRLTVLRVRISSPIVPVTTAGCMYLALEEGEEIQSKEIIDWMEKKYGKPKPEHP